MGWGWSCSLLRRKGTDFLSPMSIYRFGQMYIKYATFCRYLLDVIPTKRPYISTLWATLLPVAHPKFRIVGPIHL